MFSSATRGQFLNVSTLLASMATWSQKLSNVQIFERRSCYEIIRQNVTGGSDFQWFLHHNYQVSLNKVLSYREAAFIAFGPNS